MSATPDNTLADPEQLIADLRRRLAEREAEQTATAEILEVINSSPGDLAPIFDAILEKALRVCSATFGMMSSHDNGRLRNVAARGLPAAYNNWRLEHPLEARSFVYPPTLQRILAGEAVVHEPRFRRSGQLTSWISPVGGVRYDAVPRAACRSCQAAPAQ